MFRKKMNKKEAKVFKDLINKRKEEIVDSIKHASDDVLKKSQRDAAGDISSYTLHMADVASDTYDREFALSLAANEQKLLYEIEDALKKIDEGEYGFCESCKKPISKTRLKAVPYARFCLACQKNTENL